MQSANKIFLFVLASLLAGVTVKPAKAIPPRDCSALVRIHQDLWLYASDGTALAQVTADHAQKFAAALSKDGTRVAYATGATPEQVVVVDNTGRFVAHIDLHLQDAITELQWLPGNVLQVGEHVTPTTSKFHFYRLQQAKNITSLLQMASGSGSSCVTSSADKAVACQQGDSVAVNGHDVYSLPSASDPAAGAARFESGVTGDASGRLIAFVYGFERGDRRLVVLTRPLSAKTSTTANHWVIALDQPISTAGPVEAIDFPEETLLRLRGHTFTLNLETSRRLGQLAVARITSKAPWPKALRLKVPVAEGDTVPVMNWACPAKHEPTR